MMVPVDFKAAITEDVAEIELVWTAPLIVDN